MARMHQMAVIPRSSVRSAWQIEEKKLSAAEPSSRGNVPDLDETMALVADGDRLSFARLYDELSPAVFGVIRRIVRSQAHAEEVTQEVFLEVWRKADAWKPQRGAPTTWVLMIARARATDRVRSEQASRNRQDRVAPRWTERPADEVGERVTIQEEHDQIRATLSELTSKQREVIDLAYYGGKTYLEVAEILELPLGTVKTRMRDGLKRMRDKYGATR